jgi:NADPH2:quinone reductase
MKAIRVHEFGDPSVLKYEDAPDPVPAAGQVVLRANAIGVNPVETYIRAGKYGPKPMPFTPGGDAAGTVHATGPNVTRFKRGDRAYVAGAAAGSYAELVLADATKIHPLPEKISFQQGAALGVPYGTAYRALFQRGGGNPAETVLVHGATGGVGLAAVQLAHAVGMRIIATGGTPQGRELIQKNGADFALDHHALNYTDEILKISDGGVDLILEMLANANLGKDLTLLRRNGRVVVIGSRGRVEIDPRDTMAREADIRGMILGGASETEYAAIHAAIAAGLKNGSLNPIIDKEFPLADAAKAHKTIMQSPHLGKIVLIP